MMTTYEHVRNGDTVIVQGYRFRVQGIRRFTNSCHHTGAGWHVTDRCDDCGPNAGREYVRFTGVALDESLRSTSYNGGSYGGWVDVPVGLVARTGEEN